MFYCEGVKHGAYVTRLSLNPILKDLLDYVEGILNLFDLFTKKIISILSGRGLKVMNFKVKKWERALQHPPIIVMESLDS